MPTRRLTVRDHLIHISAAVEAGSVYLPNYATGGRGMRFWWVVVDDVTNGVTVYPDGQECDAVTPAVTVDGGSSYTVPGVGVYGFLPYAPYPHLARDWYVLPLYGLTETLSFGGGSSGDVATLTLVNGLVVAKTLVP